MIHVEWHMPESSDNTLIMTIITSIIIIMIVMILIIKTVIVITVTTLPLVLVVTVSLFLFLSLLVLDSGEITKYTKRRVDDFFPEKSTRFSSK